MNRIIRSAGIPRGSFYMYFTDKEELFGHLMDSYGALLERRMGELLEQRDLLRELIRRGSLTDLFLKMEICLRGYPTQRCRRKKRRTIWKCLSGSIYFMMQKLNRHRKT